MAQQHINYGAFPDDLNADAIRAAFQKSEENFTELYAGAATAGVSRITAGPGIVLQGNTSGAGNVTIAAALSAVNINTDVISNNLLITGSPLRSSVSAISINVNRDNFRVNNIDVSNGLTIGGLEALSYDALNNRVVIGNSVTPIDGSFIANITPKPFDDPNVGANPAPGQIQFVRNINGTDVIVGSNAFTFDNISNTLTTTNLTVPGVANIIDAIIRQARITSNTDSNGGNVGTGALVVTGGVGIGGSLSLGNANSNHTIYGTTNQFGDAYITGNTNSGNGPGGGLVLTGTTGASIGGNIYVGGSANIANTLTVQNNTDTSFHFYGGGNIDGNLQLRGFANIGSNVQIAGHTQINNTANITGNVWIGSNLEVMEDITGNNITANVNLDVGQDANIGRNLFVDGAAYINLDLRGNANAIFDGNLGVAQNGGFGGNVTITSGVIPGSVSEGALVIQGGAGISNGIYLGQFFELDGYANISGDTDIGGNLTVDGNITVSNLVSLNTQIHYNNNGNIAGHANLLYYNGNSTVMTGNVRTTSAVSVGGALTVTGTSTLTGAVTAGNTFRANGATTLASTLAVTGTSTLTGAVTAASTLRANGATTLASTLAVSGAATFSTNITQSAGTANLRNTRVTGTLNVSGATTLSGGLSVSGGDITCTADIIAYSSDRRLKENIVPIQDAIEKACAIRGYMFDWTDDYLASKGGEDGFFVVKKSAGIIAQDVQAVMPELVRTKEDGMLAVDYPKLVSIAFAAVYELKEKIETLQQQVVGLEQELQQLKEKDSE